MHLTAVAPVTAVIQVSKYLIFNVLKYQKHVNKLYIYLHVCTVWSECYGSASFLNTGICVVCWLNQMNCAAMALLYHATCVVTFNWSTQINVHHQPRTDWNHNWSKNGNTRSEVEITQSLTWVNVLDYITALLHGHFEDPKVENAAHSYMIYRYKCEFTFLIGTSCRMSSFSLWCFYF